MTPLSPIILAAIIFWLVPTYLGWRIGLHRGIPWIGLLLGIALSWAGVAVTALIPGSEDFERRNKLAQGYAVCPFCVLKPLYARIVSET